MFADLMYVFLSSSFLQWMNARVIGFAGHPRIDNRHPIFPLSFLSEVV